MDLVSSIRKSGSRGGVNFSWDEVANSTHRENYLGHSLKAPVGRWQQGRDLTWYSKDKGDGEEEKAEEMRKVKMAEEEAMAKALGLPPPNKEGTGGNEIAVQPGRGFDGKEEAEEPKEKERRKERRSHRHGDSERRERRRERSRSRDRGGRERRHERSRRERHRSRSADRDDTRRHRYDRRSRSRSDGETSRRRRSRSRDRRRDRSRSRERAHRRRDV